MLHGRRSAPWNNGGRVGRLIGVVLSTSHQWLVRAGLFFGLFVLLVAVVAGFGLYQVQTLLDDGARAQMRTMSATVDAAETAFKELEAQATASPCSAEFLSQMRLVSMIPDGINELLYMPGGTPLCSVNFSHFYRVVDLGPPDVARAGADGSVLWLSRPLDVLGYPGMVGSVVKRGKFAVVVPSQAYPPALDWAKQASAVQLADGTFKRIDDGTEPWPFDSNGAMTSATDALLPRMWSIECRLEGGLCVAQTTTLGVAMARFAGWVTLGFAMAALGAAWLSGVTHGLLRRHFAFEARFLRHFTADRIICTYQPVLDMATGRVSGCEVLVRWRDLDDRVVFPDQFLPTIEKRGLTVTLTKFVIDRAHAELSAHMPEHLPLQVNFNVSPRDLDADVLLPLLSRFDLEQGQFRVVVEIVETEAFDFEKAGSDIDQLRRAGVGCYLDDFGRGFSSIHSLAALAVDGVKLDRSFAMASEASLLGQMLPEALAMIRHAGRKTVVEGVETEERLQMLRASGLADFAQGYLIARPLSIQRFVQHIVEYDANPRQFAGRAPSFAPAPGTVVALRR